MVSLERIVLSLIKSRRLNSWWIQVGKCKLLLQYVMTEPCWYRKVKSTKSFPLERYLEKIIAIKNHIDCLAKYAHSPRLRHHFFHKEFMVETFGQPARNVVMSKPSDWGSIISYALQFEQDASSPELDDMYAALRSNRKYRGTIRTPVHCECAVIVHFHNRHESKVLPVEYIGVSKLSCKGCALFLKPSMRLLAPDSAHETHIRNGTSHGICLNVIQDLSTNLGVIWSDTSRAQPTPLGSSFAEEADWWWPLPVLWWVQPHGMWLQKQTQGTRPSLGWCGSRNSHPTRNSYQPHPHFPVGKCVSQEEEDGPLPSSSPVLSPVLANIFSISSTAVKDIALKKVQWREIILLQHVPCPSTPKTFKLMLWLTVGPRVMHS